MKSNVSRCLHGGLPASPALQPRLFAHRSHRAGSGSTESRQGLCSGHTRCRNLCEDKFANLQSYIRRNSGCGFSAAHSPACESANLKLYMRVYIKRMPVNVTTRSGHARILYIRKMWLCDALLRIFRLSITGCLGSTKSFEPQRFGVFLPCHNISSTSCGLEHAAHQNPTTICCSCFILSVNPLLYIFTK